jgi:hypothetical protein
MDINKSITFVFDDKRWITKILIGGVVLLFSFLIIPIFFLYGYMVKIIRNVMDGLDDPLPEWEKWGLLLKDGFAIVVATLVYTLPIWILMCCSILVFLPVGSLEGNAADIMAGIGVLALVLMSCLFILFAIGLALVAPAITIQYAREGNLSACFRFGEVLGMVRDNIGDILISLLVLFGISFALSLIGIIPIVGWVISFLASIYTIFVTGHLYGQIGAKIGGAPKEKEFEPLS